MNLQLVEVFIYNMLLHTTECQLTFVYQLSELDIFYSLLNGYIVHQIYGTSHFTFSVKVPSQISVHVEELVFMFKLHLKGRQP